MEKNYVLESSLDGMSKVRASFDSMSDAILFGKFAELVQGPDYLNADTHVVLKAMTIMIGKMTIIYVSSDGERRDVTAKYRDPDFRDAAYDLSEMFGFAESVVFEDKQTGNRFGFTELCSALKRMDSMDRR